MNLRAADGTGLSAVWVASMDRTWTCLTSISCSGACPKPNLCSSSTSAHAYQASNSAVTCVSTSGVMVLAALGSPAVMPCRFMNTVASWAAAASRSSNNLCGPNPMGSLRAGGLLCTSTSPCSCWPLMSRPTGL